MLEKAPSALGPNCRFTSPPHEALIASLRRGRHVTSDRVESVMSSVDRGYYVQRNPYTDAPQLLGWNSIISAPSVHAKALELLSDWLQPGAQVLDVGCGSGYLTSCMGLLVMGSGGHVTGVDHIKELATQAETNIKRDQPLLFDDGHVHIEWRDARYVREMKMYDVIHIGAVAPAFPRGLLDCLKTGGRMLLAIDEEEPMKDQPLYVVDKHTDGKSVAEKVAAVKYVPLCDADLQVGALGG